MRNFILRLLAIIYCVAGLGASPLHAADLIGYLPYYRLNANYLNNVLPDQLALLDEVRYFGLSVNGSGAITALSGNVATHKANIAAVRSAIEALPPSQRPRLNVTLGGADVDGVFSSIAASAPLRATLAQNVAALLNETGATSVDVDWEHPDAGVERTTAYPALLKRIKQEVGPTKRVYATVDPSVVIANSVLTGTDAIDGISLMTYDLGWWGNDPGNAHDLEHSLHEYVVDAVNAWTDPIAANSQRPYVWTNASWGNNVSASQLGVGLPFYGRNVHGNDAYTYADLVSGGTPQGNGYYSIAGQTVWIPDRTTIENRVQLAHDEGLQHIIIWELGQDLHPDHADSMLRIAADKLAALQALPGDFNGDQVVDGLDLAQWQDDFGLNADSDADRDGDSDGADFLIWQRAVAAGAVATTAAVPEPAAWHVLIALIPSWRRLRAMISKR